MLAIVVACRPKRLEAPNDVNEISRTVNVKRRNNGSEENRLVVVRESFIAPSLFTELTRL